MKFVENVRNYQLDYQSVKVYYMNTQDQIMSLENKIQEIRHRIAVEKCNYKIEYQNLHKLEEELRKLILQSCQQ